MHAIFAPFELFLGRVQTRTRRPLLSTTPWWHATCALALMIGAATTLGSSRAHANLDLVFLLDTTGSMGAELAEARTRVKEIVQALKTARPGETIRTGVVAYRDRGDEYLTRESDMTESVEKTNAFLDTLLPGGGGDSPEDVVAGLRAALKLEWSKEESTEKQIFLVADAQPHLDYDDNPKLETLLDDAVKKRIVIHTIGCRSLSSQGIAAFRLMSKKTEGRYQHIGRVRLDGTRSLTDAIVAAATGGGSDVPLEVAKLISTRRRPDPMKAKSEDADVVTLRFIEPSTEAGQEGPSSKVAVFCAATVRMPRGLSLSAPPRVSVTGLDRVRVRLSVAPGNVSGMSFKLPRCVRPDAEINIEIGG